MTPFIQRPIFIHAMWRSCGTYIFNKFRENPAYHTYFEPCSELLTASSANEVTASLSDELHDSLRHTAGKRQSFTAFPFDDAGGVRGFKQRFAYDRFHLDKDAQDSELQEYLSLLNAHAAAQNRTTVAKCCRFGLRAEWISRVFDAVSIYIVRHPEAIFRSYWSFGPRSYFFSASLLIVAKNRHLPVFSEIGDELRVPSLCDVPLQEAFRAAARFLGGLTAQDLRDLILALWAATFAQNARVSAIIIDVDLLGRSQAYRRSLVEQFVDSVGQNLSFCDARSANLPPSPGRAFSLRGVTWAKHAVKAVGHVEAHHWNLSDESRAAIQLLL
jgi:hypothetical protein